MVAIVFGAIKVDKYKVWGIWSGKTPDNWYAEEVDVEG
jgi:hypothetical protein